MGQIDFKDGDSRATGRGEAFEKRAVPEKMLPPPIAARIEKRNNAFR